MADTGIVPLVKDDWTKMPAVAGKQFTLQNLSPGVQLRVSHAAAKPALDHIGKILGPCATMNRITTGDVWVFTDHPSQKEVSFTVDDR